MNSQTLKEDTVLKRINEKCDICNFSFLGFNSETKKYVNNRTKLILKCNKCGYEWNTTSYEKFILRNNKCLKCCKKIKLSEKEKEEKCIKKCQELDYSFMGFEKNGNLILKCNKCGYEWNTTSYENFLKKDRKSHTCKRKNPSYKEKNFKDKNKIEKEIKEKIKNTNLEFIGFVEKEILPIEKYHVLLKCKICGNINKYLCHGILYTNKNIKCKTCENYKKRKNEEVLKAIYEKCVQLDYTFMGFENEINRYINKNTKLHLKCNKCGYEWKTTRFRVFDNKLIKCHNCNNYWKMEKEIKEFLEKENIKYEEQKRFEWLKNKIALTLDFFLNDFNIAIECQGIQHFYSKNCFGGEENFVKVQERDYVKYEQCKSHGIKILYFNDEDNVTTFLNEEIIKNINDLKKIIYGEKN